LGEGTGLLIRKLTALLPLTLLLGLLLFPRGVLASGIGVTPGILRLEAYPLMKTSGPIEVLNTSEERGVYQVYAEGEVGGWLSISPEEFVLEAGGSQVVEVAVMPPLGTRGDYEAMICAVSVMSASELKVGCGVQVPLQVSVGLVPPVGKVAEFVVGSPIVWLIIAVVLAIAIPLTMRRRRKHREI
jgi:hypothetical protein